MESENAHQPSKTSLSVKKTSLTTILKPLHNKNRNALKDANPNNIKGTIKVLQKQVYVDKEVKVVTEEEEEAEAEIEKTEYTQPDVQHQQEEESIKTEFFNDNKTRYKPKAQEEEEEFMAPVPILPIVVPKHLRQTIIDQHTKVGAKRNHADDGNEQNKKTNIEKKQKYSDKVLFKPNAPALNIEIAKETETLELQQETRAKMAMLQTSETLKEHQLGDPMLVAEYSGEIFGYFFDAETKSMGDPTYALNLQHEVNWNMRGVLIDWVIELHHMFQLLPETLFLTVNIIDRFLSTRTVVLSKLQLVGITSLFIATKFEEISCPTMQDFLFMTDNAVKEDELIKAERFILQILDFRLCYPNPVNFLRRVCSNESKSNIHTRVLAKYFMEISCVDHRFIDVRPSKIAAASLWLSKKMLATGKWNSNLSRLAGYTPEELKPTVEAMLDFLAQPVVHDSFFKKWATVKLSKASIFVRDWINRYYINE